MNKYIYYSMLLAMVLIAVNNSASAQISHDSVNTVVIKVGGIGCEGDMTIIKKKLINQEGIDEVTFTAKKNEASTFSIIYHQAIITEKKIHELIESAPCCDNPNEFPYKAKIVKPKTTKKLK